MDWTTVLTAAVTGLVGYSGAWLQSRTTVIQAREETRRVELQHREEHLRNRQGTYHEFLKLLRDYDLMMIDWAARDDALVNAWTERYVYFRAGIELFGTPNVIEATKPVGEALVAASALVQQGAPGAPRHELLRKSYTAKRDEVISARDALVAVMREDVAVPYVEPSS